MKTIYIIFEARAVFSLEGAQIYEVLQDITKVEALLYFRKEYTAQNILSVLTECQYVDVNEFTKPVIIEHNNVVQ